jgi:hypothetical protein
VQSGYKKSSVEKGLVEFRDARLLVYFGSRGIELSRQLQNNGKKEIRRYKEDLMCDVAVARIRLVKTEHPSACATVNCKVCRIALAL